MAKRTLVILGLRHWRRGWSKQADRMDDNQEEWDLGMWQEMEKDKTVKERLDRILDAEERGVRDAEEEDGQDKTIKERLNGILDAEEEEPVPVLRSEERTVA